MKTVFPLLALLLLPIDAFSVDTFADEAPWFNVELVIFEHLDPQAIRAESWRQEEELPFIEGTHVLTPSSKSKKNASLPPYAELAFKLLPSKDRYLNKATKEMADSQLYKPLLHIAWRQPVLDKEQAKPVHIRSQGNTIDGLITLSLARYLHLDADILYHHKTANFTSDNDQFAGIQTFRLKESRRMRSKELHYFDHPMFGMIVKITPYELPEPSPVADRPVIAPTKNDSKIKK